MTINTATETHGEPGAISDPITTELVRHSLRSAAEQMKRTMIKTAFSPIVYEALDFAVAIYDRDVRMLTQAPTFPLFMGTLDTCVRVAVDGVGGPERLLAGDILLYNDPFGTGSHQQDAALVMPVFYNEELVGYTAVKAHWLDIGAKDPYSTDTVDVFQEGIIFPGVHLYRGGERVPDIYRIALANSRLPRMVAGDINAEVGALRIGAAGLARVIDRYTPDVFWPAVEQMYAHGQSTMEAFLASVPDGRYVGSGALDSDGINDQQIPFEIAVEISGSHAVVDFTDSPPETEGPHNCPRPSTVSVARVAMAMLAGVGNDPNEGHFAPIEVRTREGTLFDPLPPAPCYMYGWPAFQAIEVIFHALSQAIPERVPSFSGGDICSLMYWGTDPETGQAWADGGPHPIGQGAHANGDGQDSLVHIGAAGCRLSALEVWESRNPWVIESAELAPDTGGPGKYRGGLGVQFKIRALADQWITMCFERTKEEGWALEGGLPGPTNGAEIIAPDGTRTALKKGTRLPLTKGSVLVLNCAGGGGYGRPEERDPQLVLRDLEHGYVSDEHARAYYGHAFE